MGPMLPPRGEKKEKKEVKEKRGGEERGEGECF